MRSRSDNMLAMTMDRIVQEGTEAFFKVKFQEVVLPSTFIFLLLCLNGQHKSKKGAVHFQNQ